MEFIRALIHPSEIGALLVYKLKRKISSRITADVKSNAPPELKKCYYYMDMLSKRFSVATRSVDGELRDALCVYFLVMRALDGIEDDPSISIEEKLRLLPEFYRFLENPSWTYKSGKDKNGVLLEDFTTISSQYRRLKPPLQAVISDVCARMGAGMATHLNKAFDTIQVFEEYAFCVSTIYFMGVVQMYSALGTDHTNFDEDTYKFHSIGVFQLNVDFIHDFYEDTLERRQFWAREIWDKYVTDFSELSHPKKTSEALKCLNEMVANSLKDIPGVLQCLDRIQNLPVFEYFAVLQVLSMAILERCYNNQQLLRGRFDIRKGETAYLIMRAKNNKNVKALFYYYLKKIEQRIPDKDPSAEVTRSAIKRSLNLCSVSEVESVDKIQLAPFVILFAIILAIILILF